MKKLGEGGFLIAKIHQTAGRIFAKKLKEYGINEINPAQGRILFNLWRSDRIPIQQLAKGTSLGKSTLTAMLDRLEENGHIRRIPSKEDRRKILICLTDKNKSLEKVYEQVSDDMTDLFYVDFSNHEIEAFERYLLRIFNNLQRAESEE